MTEENMENELYRMIRNKEHHKYRRRIDLDLGAEYSALGLSPNERMSDRFSRMCREERAVILPGEQIVLMRTVENIPDIFTESEWAEIKENYYIHELGYHSNLAPDYYSTIASGLLAKRENADEYGKRAIDNVITLADKYLDEARLHGIQTVSLIHGKGTGALKAALWQFLKSDKRLSSFRLGRYGEGDGGVTVVELK
jgi:hypothetical protein